MARVPVAEGVFTWPSDDPAADREPLLRVRDRHVPRAGLVSALRVDRDGASTCCRGAAGCGRGRPRSSRRRRRRTRDPRATRSCPTASATCELADEVKVETRLTRDGRAADRHGHGARAGAVPHRRRRATRSSRSRSGPWAEPAPSERVQGGHGMDVAIVGVGLHPFGRFAGVSAIEMGAIADPQRARGRGRRVARHPVRVRRELRGRQPRRGGRAAGTHGDPLQQRLQRLRDRGERRSRWPPTRSGWASTTSASPSAWTSTSRARSAPTRACTRARRGTASSATSSPPSSSG